MSKAKDLSKKPRWKLVFPNGRELTWGEYRPGEGMDDFADADFPDPGKDNEPLFVTSVKTANRVLDSVRRSYLGAGLGDPGLVLAKESEEKVYWDQVRASGQNIGAHVASMALGHIPTVDFPEGWK